jgi:sirohydrochlorin ferrochelatase
MNNALLVIAHGSRLASSNDEVRALTERLRERTQGRYRTVSCAFLELAEPSIPAAIDAAAAEGSTHIVLLPYFLAGGTHVSHHIPDIVSAKQREHPDVRLELKAYVGASESMLKLLEDLT